MTRTLSKQFSPSRFLLVFLNFILWFLDEDAVNLAP